ncbi:MAG: hypothetical protein ACRCXZ_08710 [Patescibacteria group bacterium]
MTSLLPIKINKETITLKNSNDSIHVNQNVLITKDKRKFFSKIINISNESVIISNPSIDNLTDFEYELLDSESSWITNPLILGHLVDSYGQIVDNYKIYNLKQPKKSKKEIKSTFYLSHNESIEKDFVYIGINIEISIKKLIELQVNNSQNFTFINIVNPKNKYSIKNLKIFEKFNLHKKNLFLSLTNMSDYKIIQNYIEYFRNSLNSNTVLIINSDEWTETELFEFNWIFQNTPKIILFVNKNKCPLKNFCSIYIEE